MNTERKTELVANWGFDNAGDGYSMQRDIYKDQGYKEIWSIRNPDVIQFVKNGEITEEYKIDWSLYQ